MNSFSHIHFNFSLTSLSASLRSLKTFTAFRFQTFLIKGENVNSLFSLPLETFLQYSQIGLACFVILFYMILTLLSRKLEPGEIAALIINNIALKETDGYGTPAYSAFLAAP
jgi:hypothetical protein